MALKLGKLNIAKTRQITSLYANFFQCLSTSSSKPPISEKIHNKLENDLIKRIKMKGPLTVAEFMKEALGNPIHVLKQFFIMFLKIYP
jgi:hypothetical protein